MARAKRATRPEAEPDLAKRDFVMARLAAARASAQSAISAIDDALVLFVDPDDDEGGGEREEMIGEALEAIGGATRALESAEKEFETLEDAELETGEPWDDKEDR